MKDNRTTVKGEDWHTSNKAIHFTRWRSWTDRQRTARHRSRETTHQIPPCSAWGTSCACVYLVTDSFNNQCLRSGEVEVGLTWEHMCYMYMKDNYIQYMYYVYLCMVLTWLLLQPSSIIHVDTVVEWKQPSISAGVHVQMYYNSSTYTSSVQDAKMKLW